MSKTKVVIADDHRMIRRVLAIFLNSSEHIQIIGEAENGEELLKLMENGIVNIALIDLNMPVVDGIQAIRIIKEKYPFTKVIIVSMCKERSLIKKVFDLGAYGFLSKNCTEDDLLKAIETVRSGKKYLCDEHQSLFIEDYVKGDNERIENLLSKREIEIIHMIEKGLTSKSISEQLFLSIKTIECHRGNIYKKLKVKNVAELIQVIKSNIQAYS